MGVTNAGMEPLNMIASNNRPANDIDAETGRVKLSAKPVEADLMSMLSIAR
jgi:hypothetical protein